MNLFIGFAPHEFYAILLFEKEVMTCSFVIVIVFVLVRNLPVIEAWSMQTGDLYIIVDISKICIFHCENNSIKKETQSDLFLSLAVMWLSNLVKKVIKIKEIATCPGAQR
jgi:hypothetical protein